MLIPFFWPDCIHDNDLHHRCKPTGKSRIIIDGNVFLLIEKLNIVIAY